MHNTTKKTINIILGCFCIIASCSIVEAASPRRAVNEGNRYYKQGDYQASRLKYEEALAKNPESDIVNFNLGTAFYREKEYEHSSNHFQKVLLTDDGGLKERAHYNLGNALYKLGMSHTESDINTAISSLENSLNQYKRALSINEKDKEAKHNYDFVGKELVRLKEKRQQQQDQKSSDESQKQEKEQEQQQGQQQQEQEKQSQDQQERQEQKQQQEQQSEQGKEEKQGQEENSDQGRGQQGEEEYNKQQEAGTSSQDAQELTQKEAQMLLESYQQAEEPQGLLQVHPKAGDARPVLKDW